MPSSASRRAVSIRYMRATSSSGDLELGRASDGGWIERLVRERETRVGKGREGKGMERGMMDEGP